jgi:hypothetical protein
MSKLNLDTSQKINIECKAQDSFEFNLEVKNQDDSNYVFYTEDTWEKEIVIFSVVDFEGEPIMVCTSEKNINWIPGTAFDANNNVVIPNLPEYMSVGDVNDFGDFDENNIPYGQATVQNYYRILLEFGRARSIAISNMLNTSKKGVVGVLEDGGYKDVPYDFFVWTHNRKQGVLINNPSYTYKILEPCITVEDGLISINIQSKHFRLPEGRYSYDIKVVSMLINSGFQNSSIIIDDLVTDYSLTTGTNATSNTSAYFSNIKTWMKGALIVKK